MAYETRESVTIINENQKIFGILHQPLHMKKVPAVIVCHGLGGSKSGGGRIYVKLAEGLAKKGIATLRIDFRGSGDSEGNFEDMTVETQVSDTLAALDFIQHHSGIDPKKIGFFGCSFGGAIALEAARQSQQATSIAVWAPLFDGEQWLERWQSMSSNSNLTEMDKYRLMSVGGSLPGVELYAQMFKIRTDSTLKELHEVPFLHIYGEKDNVINSRHTEKYEKGRTEASAATRFVRYPQTDHDFSNPIEQKQALEETLNWFSKTLNPR